MSAKDRIFSSSRARRARGRLTMDEIAAATGVSRHTVSRWENGAGEPSVTQLARLAAATRRRLDYFLEAAP